MKNFTKLSVLIVLMVVVVFNPISLFSQDIEIQVSPNILNLQSNGVVVTIHTNVDYSSVDASTVELNSVEIQSWKADEQGNFVAKFNMDDIKGLPGLKIGEYNTLTLEGQTSDGETFIGSEEVLVINKVPKGKR